MKVLTRVLSSLFLAAVIIPAYYFRDGIYFYWVLRFGFLIALIEFATVVCESRFLPIRPDEYTVTALICIELLVSLVGVGHLPTWLIGGSVLVCVITDGAAYLMGTLVGGQLIASRPFPKTSPNKSFEGLLFGLACGVVAAFIWDKSVLRPNGIQASVWRLVAVAPISVLGDLLESRFKRLCDVKDANDYVLETPVLRWIEKPLGGRNGHGGYLDRLDSLALVIAFQLLIP